MRLFFFLVILTGSLPTSLVADDRIAVTLKNYLAPEPLTAAETIRSEFSYSAATRAADHAAMNWQQSHSCVTCHTNGFYLIGRALTCLLYTSPSPRDS